MLIVFGLVASNVPDDASASTCEVFASRIAICAPRAPDSPTAVSRYCWAMNCRFWSIVRRTFDPFRAGVVDVRLFGFTLPRLSTE